MTEAQIIVLKDQKRKDALAIFDRAMGIYHNKQWNKALDEFEIALKNLSPNDPKTLRYVNMAKENGSDCAYQLAKGMYDRR